MENGFKLPVVYKDEEQEFDTMLIHTAYTMRFDVEVYGLKLSFEKDDEGNFRVINYNPENEKGLPASLLEAIIVSLEQLID